MEGGRDGGRGGGVRRSRKQGGHVKLLPATRNSYKYKRNIYGHTHHVPLPALQSIPSPPKPFPSPLHPHIPQAPP